MFGWHKGEKPTPSERPQLQPTILGAPDKKSDGSPFGNPEDYSPPTLRTESSLEAGEGGVVFGREKNPRNMGQQVLHRTEIDER